MKQRRITTAALAAKEIRKEIKAAFPAVAFRCTCDNYSGGDSVDVNIADQPYEVYKAIEQIVGKYQMGKFNGMEDIYEYSNRDSELPQVKYTFVRNEMTDTKKQEVFAKVRNYWCGGDALPESYDEARNIWFENTRCYVSELVWRTFNSPAQEA